MAHYMIYGAFFFSLIKIIHALYLVVSRISCAEDQEWKEDVMATFEKCVYLCHITCRIWGQGLPIKWTMSVNMLLTEKVVGGKL